MEKFGGHSGPEKRDILSNTERRHRYEELLEKHKGNEDQALNELRHELTSEFHGRSGRE